MIDEQAALSIIRQQRDTLLFYLDAYFAAEQAHDRRGCERALGALACTMTDIAQSPYPYDKEPS